MCDTQVTWSLYNVITCKHGRCLMTTLLSTQIVLLMWFLLYSLWHLFRRVLIQALIYLLQCWDGMFKAVLHTYCLMYISWNRQSILLVLAVHEIYICIAIYVHRDIMWKSTDAWNHSVRCELSNPQLLNLLSSFY